MSEFQVQWEALYQKIRWQVAEEDTWCQPLASACTYKYTWAVQSSRPPKNPLLCHIPCHSLRYWALGYWHPQETTILPTTSWAPKVCHWPWLMLKAWVHHEVVKTLQVWCIVLGIWQEPGYASEMDGCWEDTRSTGAYIRPWTFRKDVQSQGHHKSHLCLT